MKELFVDNFAGGGGASTGIEAAIGRSVDIAINHDPDAIAMHKANHPASKHYCEDVWQVDPVAACAGNPVALAWFSPDCKHFSRAKGGKPVDKNIRGLAWVAIKWAYTVRPKVVMLENVPEIQTWGPLGKDGKPNADEVLESITKINDVPIARINALADADKDGRVVILPCHVGDIVYDIEDGTPYATRVVSFVMFRDGSVSCKTVSSFPDVESFGTRIFLILTEAEKALAKEKK